MAAPSAAQSFSDDGGPVLNLINKRLRALRKKWNRILQMEDSLSHGRSLNRDQEETLRSKSSVIASIGELEKLRQPLAQAVDQEIQIALEKNNHDSKSLTEERVSLAVSDLLGLVYFGAVFDTDTLMRVQGNMVRRIHERNCCLSYDVVVDDDYDAEILKEWDLDLISKLGGLMTSRPLDSCLSHKNSLQKCVEHAKLWLENSKQPIQPNSRITYASLRGMLNKIMASDYFTITPDIQAPLEVFEAVGNHTNFPVPVQGPVVHLNNWNYPVEKGSSAEFDQAEKESSNSNDNE